MLYEVITLPDNCLDVEFYFIDRHIAVIGGKVQYCQVSAADLFSEYRLAAAGAIEREPASTGIWLAYFIGGSIRKVFFYSLNYPPCIAEILVFE